MEERYTNPKGILFARRVYVSGVWGLTVSLASTSTHDPPLALRVVPHPRLYGGTGICSPGTEYAFVVIQTRQCEPPHYRTIIEEGTASMGTETGPPPIDGVLLHARLGRHDAPCPIGPYTDFPSIGATCLRMTVPAVGGRRGEGERFQVEIARRALEYTTRLASSNAFYRQPLPEAKHTAVAAEATSLICRALCNALDDSHVQHSHETVPVAMLDECDRIWTKQRKIRLPFAWARTNDPRRASINAMVSMAWYRRPRMDALFVAIRELDPAPDATCAFLSFFPGFLDHLYTTSRYSRSLQQPRPGTRGGKVWIPSPTLRELEPNDQSALCEFIRAWLRLYNEAIPMDTLVQMGSDAADIEYQTNMFHVAAALAVASNPEAMGTARKVWTSITDLVTRTKIGHHVYALVPVHPAQKNRSGTSNLDDIAPAQCVTAHGYPVALPNALPVHAGDLLVVERGTSYVRYLRTRVLVDAIKILAKLRRVACKWKRVPIPVMYSTATRRPSLQPHYLAFLRVTAAADVYIYIPDRMLPPGVHLDTANARESETMIARWRANHLKLKPIHLVAGYSNLKRLLDQRRRGTAATPEDIDGDEMEVVYDEDADGQPQTAEFTIIVHHGEVLSPLELDLLLDTDHNVELILDLSRGPPHASPRARDASGDVYAGSILDYALPPPAGSDDHQPLRGDTKCDDGTPAEVATRLRYIREFHSIHTVEIPTTNMRTTAGAIYTSLWKPNEVPTAPVDGAVQPISIKRLAPFYATEPLRSTRWNHIAVNAAVFDQSLPNPGSRLARLPEILHALEATHPAHPFTFTLDGKKARITADKLYPALLLGTSFQADWLHTFGTQVDAVLDLMESEESILETIKRVFAREAEYTI